MALQPGLHSLPTAVVFDAAGHGSIVTFRQVLAEWHHRLDQARPETVRRIAQVHAAALRAAAGRRV